MNNLHREIKFRAWDKITKQMCDVWDIGWKAWDGDGEMNYVNIYIDGVDGTVRKSEIEVVLMQYTGLKDKNGKEIYEGDIVIHRKLDFSETMLFGIFEIIQGHLPTVVEWENCGFSPFSRYNESAIKKLKYKVIGNIYENPNLVPTGIPAPD